MFNGDTGSYYSHRKKQQITESDHVEAQWYSVTLNQKNKCIGDDTKLPLVEA